MSPIASLAVSAKNLNIETWRYIKYFDKNLTALVLHDPVLLDADLDIKSYCALLRSIKNYAARLEPNTDNILIKETFAGVPDISKADFEFYNIWSGRGWLLLLFFPVGIIIWTLTYIKITRLVRELHIAGSKLSAAEVLCSGWGYTSSFPQRPYSNSV